MMLYVTFMYSYTTQAGMDVVSKELAAHKEVVAELRKQLVEKEKELQVVALSNVESEFT